MRKPPVVAYAANYYGKSALSATSRDSLLRSHGRSGGRLRRQFIERIHAYDGAHINSHAYAERGRHPDSSKCHVSL
jgi:hypothetical protein